MGLEIQKIKNPQDSKNTDEEYVILNVITEKNEKDHLGKYAIVDETFDKEGDQSNIFRHIFAFPNVEVSNGDCVHLHTGKGKNEVFENSKGSNTYKFYWGSDDFIWNNKGDEAILIELRELARFKY
jgi:hypothetical protein